MVQSLRLGGSAKRRAWTDVLKVDGYLRGEIELADALELDPDFSDRIRRHALALFQSGKHDACIDLMLGLAALGNVHPIDPLLLSKCYAALGELDRAQACLAHHQRMMAAYGEGA